MGRWLHMNRIRGNSVWLPANHSQGSWMWRQILQSRTLAESFLKVVVKNGRSTCFWLENWSSMGILLQAAGARGCLEMGIQVEASVEEVLLTHRRRRHRRPILNQIEDEIVSARSLYTVEDEDVYWWKVKADNYKAQFSTRATYDQLRQHQDRVPWAAEIWFKHHSPKFSFIVWLAVQNRLSTGDRMVVWNANVSATCSFCHVNIETRNHLFFTCSYSKKVWESLARGILCNELTTDWDSLVQIISRVTEQGKEFYYPVSVPVDCLHYMERKECPSPWHSSVYSCKID
ncbi:uncharacterized protein LOC112083039 [Eutrema salsugineum]|uniref:uncharacterized protein LOC112083039 n=1 Tax=Eutrema salsugineum TaxID=72664 RepID=UPI000CED2B02|nr:uncharacterized protein LOC112083039 [Eutrema salsugineum]